MTQAPLEAVEIGALAFDACLGDEREGRADPWLELFGS
jgi:hypothetical protein